MWAQGVFAVSMASAILSGSALFWGGTRMGAWWLDAFFLVSLAVSLALGVYFLGRRLWETGEDMGESLDSTWEHRDGRG